MTVRSESQRCYGAMPWQGAVPSGFRYWRSALRVFLNCPCRGLNCFECLAVKLVGSATHSPPVVVNVSSGFTGTQIPGAAGAASYGGNLVSTPVPEPETYTLTPAALGVVGFAAARRRNRG